MANRLRNKKRNEKRSGSAKRLFGKILLSLFFAFLISSFTLVLLFRWLPLPTSSFMIYRHIEDFIDDRTYKSIDYSWVAADKISPNAPAAVVASEDQRFYRHSGFDFHAIQTSIETYLDGGKLRGASTISQQVAKNIFLTPSKSLLRKSLEVWFTVLIEIFWTKERILTVYLNIAEFGDHLFGIEAASRYYFGIHADRISKRQAALLAATLPNPILLRAKYPSAYVLKRQNWILRQMRNQ